MVYLFCLVDFLFLWPILIAPKRSILTEESSHCIASRSLKTQFFLNEKILIDKETKHLNVKDYIIKNINISIITKCLSHFHTPGLNKRTDQVRDRHGYGLLDTFKFGSKISISWNFEPNRSGLFCILTPNYFYYSITSNLI